MTSPPQNSEKASGINRIRQIKELHEQSLLAKPNVVGIGIGMKYIEARQTQEIALIVMVTRKVPSTDLAPEDRLPSTIEGVPIDVREVGEFEAYLG